MALHKRRMRRKFLAAGLLALALVAVGIRCLHPGGSQSGTDGTRDRALAGHMVPVQALAFDADGTTLTSAAYHYGTAQAGVEVAVWDVRTGSAVAQHHAYPGVLRASPSLPAAALAATLYNREVVLWDVALLGEARGWPCPRQRQYDGPRG